MLKIIYGYKFEYIVTPVCTTEMIAFARAYTKLPFPIVADRSGQIVRKYGMISNDVSTTETVRNVFIIDDKQIVRTIMIYPLNVGIFIPEIIRTVQALQMADCSNGSTAANWMPGNL